MVLNPLLTLLKKGTKWSWGKPQDEASQKSKALKIINLSKWCLKQQVS